MLFAVPRRGDELGSPGVIGCRVHPLNDQEAIALVGEPFQQRADADEEWSTKAQIPDGLARIVTPTGNEPAEEVEEGDGKGKLHDQLAQVHLVKIPLMSQ